MGVLEVKNLGKKYASFELKDVNFSLEEGKITGFIGRNGAGKSTTIKSLLNFVHPNSGEILFFDKEFTKHEFELKPQIGYVLEGIDFYSKKKIKTITKVTKSFYANWDDEAYKGYMQDFSLDENKTPDELSAGMKVKYALTLALSHNAKLLILDEPTSGLDPVSRDDLLDVFLSLSDKGITILFSTHITSDLDKCADNIIYIKNGEVLADESLKSFVKKYKVVEFKSEPDDKFKDKLIGCKRIKEGYSALAGKDTENLSEVKTYDANLENIMVHMEKEDK